jgi:hypothetical protein
VNTRSTQLNDKKVISGSEKKSLGMKTSFTATALNPLFLDAHGLL